jgi:hypothetical protein
MDIISKKTRSEFKEYFVTTTLREIESYFDNHDIPFTEHPNDTNYGGQRRTLVENYYVGVDWENPSISRKVLNVYQDVLNDLADNENVWNTEQNKVWFDKLSKFLLRDGFEFSNGKLSSVGQIVSFEDLQNATDLLDKIHF